MKNKLSLSPLGHTWFFDIDGTIVKHNGYKIDGVDTLLPGVKTFWDCIPQEDTIILVTSRKSADKEMTEGFLQSQGIRFDTVIYDLPYGERIIVNDNKPSGLNMSIAMSLERDHGLQDQITEIDHSL